MATAEQDEQNKRIRELADSPLTMAAMVLAQNDALAVAESDELLRSDAPGLGRPSDNVWRDDVAKNVAMIRANVAGLSAGQYEIRTVLAGQSLQLADHGKQLAENGKQLTDHGKQLADNGKQLAENGKQLTDHGLRLSALELGMRMLLERSGASPEQLRLFDEASAQSEN